jgi:hypothetical protein
MSREEAIRIAKRNIMLLTAGIIGGVAVTILLGVLISWWVAGIIGIVTVTGLVGVAIYSFIRDFWLTEFTDRAEKKMAERQTHE